MNKKQLIEALDGLNDDAEIFVNVGNDYNLHIIGYCNKVTDDDCRHEITLELED